MLFIEKTPAETPASPRVARSQQGAWGRRRPVTPGSPPTRRRPAHVGGGFICGQPSLCEMFFSYIYFVESYIFFFIEFCIGYIKVSIWFSPKANNQCRCHFARSLNCLLNDVCGLEVGIQVSPSSSEEEVGNLVRRWQPGKSRPPRVCDDGLHAKVQTANGWVFTSRSQSQSDLDGSAESSPALGVHAPCDPLLCPTSGALGAHTGGQSSSRSLSRSMKGSSM